MNEYKSEHCSQSEPVAGHRHGSESTAKLVSRQFPLPQHICCYEIKILTGVEWVIAKKFSDPQHNLVRVGSEDVSTCKSKSTDQ